MEAEVEYDYDQVLHALGETYISLHLFDLKADTLTSVKSNKFIDTWAAEKEGLQDKLSNVMANIVVPEHVESILEFVDFSTLDERMGPDRYTSMVFKGKLNGWCRARFVALERDADSELSRVIFTVENINKEKEREIHLLYVSQTDLMTGLLNRGSGESKIEEYIEAETPGAFGLFDVDHFKQVNDAHGHEVGDQVLIAIADCMKKVFRDSDVIMRLGGDEFVFYLPTVTNEEIALKVTQRLFDKIAQIHIDGMDEGVVVSLGLSFFEPGDTFKSMYCRADKAVYQSKHHKESSLTIA